MKRLATRGKQGSSRSDWLFPTNRLHNSSVYVTFIKRLPLLFAAASLLIFAADITAGPSDQAPVAPSPDLDPVFHRGVFELEVLDGVEYSVQRTTFLRPNIDYELSVIRAGYMLDSPHRGGSFLRGNDEVLLEAVGGPIFQGPGSALGGLSVVYRRNFLAPGARLVPYINMGVGGVYSDAYHDQVQRALGSKLEFDLQGALGLRFRVSERISLDGEASYRHLSNADLSSRNYGTNAIGGLLGVTFTF